MLRVEQSLISSLLPLMLWVPQANEKLPAHALEGWPTSTLRRPAATAVVGKAHLHLHITEFSGHVGWLDLSLKIKQPQPGLCFFFGCPTKASSPESTHTPPWAAPSQPGAGGSQSMTWAGPSVIYRILSRIMRTHVLDPNFQGKKSFVLFF